MANIYYHNYMTNSAVHVDIWAKEYETRRAIGGAEITDLATGERWTTGADGYARLMVDPGRTLTLAFSKAGYPRVQTSTVQVPEEGLTGADNEITMQVVNSKLEKVLMWAIGKPKPGTHYVAATVSAKGHNLHNDKGELGVTVTLRSKDGKIVRDDGIYLHSLFGKTDWFRPILSHRFKPFGRLRAPFTSHDGGVIFNDVPPGHYILEAKKDGVLIQNAEIKIYQNSPLGINASPPHGPRVL